MTLTAYALLALAAVQLLHILATVALALHTRSSERRTRSDVSVLRRMILGLRFPATASPLPVGEDPPTTRRESSSPNLRTPEESGVIKRDQVDPVEEETMVFTGPVSRRAR